MKKIMSLMLLQLFLFVQVVLGANFDFIDDKEDELFGEMLKVVNELRNTHESNSPQTNENLNKLEIGLNLLKTKNISLKNITAELKKQSLHDPKIPDIFGARFIMEWVPENFNNLRVENLSLLVIDIDNFKKVNSTFGHVQADVMLERLAVNMKAVLHKNARNDEFFLGRFGGDEFYVLLINTPEQRTREISQTLLEEVSNDNSILEDLVKNPRVKVENGQFFEGDRLTLSIGFHTGAIERGLRTPEQARHMIQSYLQLADEYLYVSKKRGKNQVTSRSCTNIF